jgi:hypothetical protein
VVFSILDLVIAKHWTYTPHSKKQSVPDPLRRAPLLVFKRNYIGKKTNIPQLQRVSECIQSLLSRALYKLCGVCGRASLVTGLR